MFAISITRTPSWTDEDSMISEDDSYQNEHTRMLPRQRYDQKTDVDLIIEV